MATGRWKANNDGSAYWDPNDTGPNQVQPTAEQQQQQQSQYGSQPTQQQSPWPSAPQSYAATGTNQTPQYLPNIDPSKFQDTQWWKGQPTTGQGMNESVPYNTQTYISPTNTGISGGAQWGSNGVPTTGVPQGGYSYMEGVDTGKLNDPNHTSPKYVASRILASGGSLQDAANAIGAKVLDQDKMQLSTGEIIDTRRDQEGANQLQWTVTYDPNQPQGGTQGLTGGTNGLLGFGSGGIGGTGSGSYGSSSISGLLGGSGLGNSYANTLWDMLMNRAQQGLNINSKDPIIANQVNSYRAEQTRGVRDALAQMAEQGGPTANLNSERRLANEKAAQSTGGLQSQLMQNELTARRTEIQNALTQMGSLLSDQQKIALQQELGMIDANLRQQQVTNQNNQFLDNFALQNTQQANYWDSLRSGLING